MRRTGLPLTMRVAGRPVILVGDGEAADAKRRLLLRAGALVVNEAEAAPLAIVALEDALAAEAAAARLKERGILVNVVDRPALCDFTLPAIVDRDPVLVAVATGGVSAGLAAALRQRLEALLPVELGRLADALERAKGDMRARWPDGGERRRALGEALREGGRLDPLASTAHHAVDAWLRTGEAPVGLIRIALASPDPDELTLRQARSLAQADRVFHDANVPPAILDRARADAPRIAGTAPPDPGPGLTVQLSSDW